MKKLLILLLSLISALALFANGKGDAASAAPAVEVSAPGQLPIVKEQVELSGFLPTIGFIEDIYTTDSYAWLEEATNVHVDWIESSKVDAKNKLSILLASGNYPDIIQGVSGSALSGQEIFKYGSQGIFIPMNDLIDEYAYNIKDMLNAEPWVESAITSPDGNIYGLPAVYTDDYHMTMRQKLWVNQKWLDNLGLDIPTTLNEFYDMLVAFKTRDANGNGDPNDEIPLTGAKRNAEDTALWIMNAFVPAGSQDDSGDSMLNQYEFIIDGKVFFSANTNEFREGLRFIKKLYDEGLLDPAALTQDRDQVKPLVDGGNASLVGGMASHHPGNFSNMGSADERYKNYVPVPPVKGPKGNQATPWLIDQVVKPGEYVITDNCEYPEVAFRFADVQFGEEWALRERGVEGTHWRHAAPSENLIGIDGNPAKYVYMETLTPEANARVNMGPGWTRNYKNEFAKSEGYSYEEMLYNATLLYDPYKVARFPYATAQIGSDDMDEFNDLRRTIHSYIGEATDRFIIGDLDLDSEWEQYVKQLDQIGLDRYLAILNKSVGSN